MTLRIALKFHNKVNIGIKFPFSTFHHLGTLKQFHLLVNLYKIEIKKNHNSSDNLI